MKKTNRKRLLSLITVIALVAAMALMFTACSDTKTSSGNQSVSSSSSADTAASDKITITVEVVDDKGETKTYNIETAETTLYGALNQEKLIDGEDGDYGFYITAVNGLTADYNVDKSYWALYKGDEYLMTGVSETNIADGELYKLVYTKE